MEFVVAIALYVIPLYIANASALIFGGGMPLDLGMKIKGKEILGKGKTVQGTLAGFFFGVVSIFILNHFFPLAVAQTIGDYIVFGVLLCLGAILGDIFASFLKRRIGLERGHPIMLLDQLDFVFGGILLSLAIRVPTLAEVAVIAVLTLAAHKLTNFIAFKLKMKKVPW